MNPAASPPSDSKPDLHGRLYFEHVPAELLGAVLDQSMDCIKVIGPTGQLDFMNRNGRCAMEIDDFDTVAGRDWWTLWPAESQSLVKDAVERACRGESVRFEAFCPTAKGSARWWDVAVSPLRGRGGELIGIVSISRDISDRVTARELRQATLDEMRHRLQNAYTLTGAIIAAAAKGSEEREAFAAEIMARLERLGIAQSLLLDPDRFGTTTLPVLARKLVEPFCPPGCDVRFGDFPPVELGEETARALALTIGELSTNSNKYGAFGSGGAIAIAASLEEGMLAIRWSETLDRVRTSRPQAGSGQGLRLIERALRASRGTIDVSWRDDGLDVLILLPSP